MDRLTITASSTALFSTWCFVEQLGVLFDCGDGVSASLLQKAGKVRHVFVTHADRDHLGGLFQFLQLNGREDLHVYYPKDCGSFPAIAEFCRKFDPHVAAPVWRPLQSGDEVSIGGKRVVRALRNEHVVTPAGSDLVKSLSYFVETETRKLKPELQGLAGHEIASRRAKGGDDAVTDVQRATNLVFAGDTPVECDGRYDNAELLIHEATFLTRDELAAPGERYNLHSSLDLLIPSLKTANVGRLILSHFSSRYSDEEIQAAVARELEICPLGCDVELILPGRVCRLEW